MSTGIKPAVLPLWQRQSHLQQGRGHRHRRRRHRHRHRVASVALRRRRHRQHAGREYSAGMPFARHPSEYVPSAKWSWRCMSFSVQS